MKDREIIDVPALEIRPYQGAGESPRRVYEGYLRQKGRPNAKRSWRLELKKKKLRLLEAELGLRKPLSLELARKKLELVELEL